MWALSSEATFRRATIADSKTGPYAVMNAARLRNCGTASRKRTISSPLRNGVKCLRLAASDNPIQPALERAV